MKKESSSTSTVWLSPKALLYMTLLAIQFGIQPIVTRKYTSQIVIRSTVVLIQEIVKFCIALSMLFLSGSTKHAIQGWKISTWISVAALPAGLYAIQNIAALLAYQNLDALTFNVLNQTKTLSAALCCYLVMGTKQSSIQILSLFLLLLSALVIEGIVKVEKLNWIISSFITSVMQQQSNTSERKLQEDIDNGDNINQQGWGAKHFTHGVAPILLASFISGLAGALSQNNLQRSNKDGIDVGRNIYLFSMELCAASIVFLTGSMLFSSDGQRIKEQGFWYGWEWTTSIPILTNSAGGIIVGLVTKHAGSVQKGFALIFGILLSGIIQAIIQPEKTITPEQWAGGIIAAISLYLHATNPPRILVAKTTKIAKQD